MLNTKDGAIEGLPIRSGLTEDEFIGSDLYQRVKEKSADAYIRYYLNPLQIGDEVFWMSLFFNPTKLLSNVFLEMKCDEAPSSWDDWSEERELQKKDRHDKWLEEMIGPPPYEYSWGKIFSDFDIRSGSSSIGIIYKYE